MTEKFGRVRLAILSLTHYQLITGACCAVVLLV